MYAVTGRDAQIAGKSRFASPTTTWLQARSVLRNRKLKIKRLDAWDSWICEHNANGKVVTPTPRNQLQRVSGYVSLHKDTAARRAATRALDRLSLQRPIIVFSNKGTARLTPIYFSASDTIVRYESTRGLRHGLAIRRTRSHSSIFRVHWEFYLRGKPFADRISRTRIPQGTRRCPHNARRGKMFHVRSSAFSLSIKKTEGVETIVPSSCLPTAAKQRKRPTVSGRCDPGMPPPGKCSHWHYSA